MTYGPSVPWRVERADFEDGRSSHLVIDDESFQPHSEAMEFVAALYATDRSANTVRTYVRPVAAFLNWCESQGVDWRRVTILDMARFKRSLETATTRTGRVRAPSTVSVHLTAVSELLRYCAAAGLIPSEVPMQLVERKWMPHAAGLGPLLESGYMRHVRVSALRVRPTEHAPETLSESQQQALIEGTSSARDLFLVRLLLDAGLRIGEALGLRWEDMHFLPDSSSLGCPLAGAHLHVVRRTTNSNGALAKSLRSRSIPVHDSLVRLYRDYRFEREEKLVGSEPCDVVFVNYTGPRTGQAMSYSNVYQLVKRLAARHGFRATPHMFRHTAATGWVESGVQADVVQELLGHAQASSTKVYLHPSRERMREAVDAVAGTR